MATEIPAIEVLETPTMRAIAVGLEKGLTDLEILDAKLQSVGQLSLRQFGYSKGFTSPIVEGELLFGIPDGIDEDGNPKFKLVASFKRAEFDKETCLLFLPKSLMADEQQSTTEYIIQLMDMSLSSFQFGHTRIINLTPWETNVSVGEQNTTVTAWNRSTFAKIQETSGVSMAQVEVSYIQDGTANMAYQTRIRYQEDIRYTIFIYSDIKNERIRVRVVKDLSREKLGVRPLSDS
ncbi:MULTISPECIES: hypothetical protein [unclassified Lentimonas]|uniref:hypothetical protein n=1 Tax=unclassified Lentimonas TaxID=2630993 RepID=UPI001321C9ED|nr:MULTISPECIES: hypothetical protein [unclassified Lentimonas]CAA6677582.1 Unannotated [Lentimonas sp. CC4]CAA6684320.1 Unannotated [Lentimonas sp. CC6]CAA6692126.1 Unannotated [Lentimonas sp. CC19]CAA6694493.1 Unannotated [Lentimonas sp. CC10]CAA7070621.1 Unannotated [Lentimonas sp. CC11]